MSLSVLRAVFSLVIVGRHVSERGPTSSLQHFGIDISSPYKIDIKEANGAKIRINPLAFDKMNFNTPYAVNEIYRFKIGSPCTGLNFYMTSVVRNLYAPE